ncbi:hypothetical protein NMG60_11034777 [Bertholletia excelsa]
MTTGIMHEQNLEKQIEKQMGCMAGFFQLFDRHQILTGKRFYATKRLPPTAVVDSTPEPEKCVSSPAVSPAISRELEKISQPRVMTFESPESSKGSPVKEARSPAANVATEAGEMPAKLPVPLPILAFKEGTRSSWKFCKEAPRLSLDSRASFDAKGRLYAREIRTNTASLSRCEDSGDGASTDGDDKRRSPSVIARLMGLEPLPHPSPEPTKKIELRRSASESRVSRDLFQNRLIDANNFQLRQPHQSHFPGVNISNNAAMEKTIATLNARPSDPVQHCAINAKSEQQKPLYRCPGPSPWRTPQQRKSYFDSEDFFPEPKQNVSIYGEIERRLKMRGIDEPSKDLETLKQILEALQLKGLLHSKKTVEQSSNRNFVYEPSYSSDESPIVLMKPSRSPVSPVNRRFASDLTPSNFRSRANARRIFNNAGESLPSVSQLETDRTIRNQARFRNSSSPTRRENNLRSPNSPTRRTLTVETQRKANVPSEQRRASPVHSPKVSSRRTGPDQTITTRSPRNKKPTPEIEVKEKLTVVAEDESSSISESSVSTPSQTDTERSKTEEYKEGRTLLERCDKLLHSIAEMTATELQPSPVSVLDSSLYKDESSSPSPVMKRSIDFKVSEFEEEIWSPAISPIQSRCDEISDDCDFIYISDILRASNYLPEDCDVFLLLEKQQYLKGKDTSRASRLQRKLIFDTITEILDRNRQLPPWKLISHSNSSALKPSLRQIWSEFQRIRERDTAGAEDLFDTICGVLRKDLAEDAINGWGDCPVEMSEAMLDIERLIFKDLVGEMIRDLAAFAGGRSATLAPRRRLVF